MIVEYHFSFELLKELFQTGAVWPPNHVETLEGFPGDAVLWECNLDAFTENVAFRVETSTPGPIQRSIVVRNIKAAS